MNTELLEKIAAHIEAHPDDFRMESYVCGTACCIAGEVVRMERPDTFKRWSAEVETEGLTFRNESFFDAGRQLLELTQSETNRLFLMFMWPEEFEDRYVKAKSAEEKAKAGVDRIYHFIETEGRE